MKMSIIPTNGDQRGGGEKKKLSVQQIGTAAVTRRGEKEMEPKVVVHPQALENSAGGWMLT